MNIEELRSQLIEYEGIRLKPYTCPAGKLTIGVGRNIQDLGISHSEAIYLLDNDIKRVISQLDAVLPWWRGMDEVRQRVLADMCFNMGITRLMSFKKTLAAMEAHDYRTAALEMEDSKWFTQVGRRGVALVAMMRTGG
jgi:lysozyme